MAAKVIPFRKRTITPTTARALALIAEHPWAGVGYVADTLRVSHTEARAALERLVCAGVLEPDPDGNAGAYHRVGAAW